MVASYLKIAVEEAQDLLSSTDVRARLEKLIAILTREIELLELGHKIQSQVQTELNKNQREYYLRQQLKAIQKELGEGDSRSGEMEEIEKKIEAAKMPEEARKAADKELDRLKMIPPESAEHTVVRTYLDWLVTAAVGDFDRRQSRYQACAHGARRRSFRSREGQGAHPRVPCGAQAEERHQGADPVFRRATGNRQDLARTFHRTRDGAQVRAGSRSAASATRLRFADIGAPTSARCPAASSRGSATRAPIIRCSSSTLPLSRRRSLRLSDLPVLDPVRLVGVGAEALCAGRPRSPGSCPRTRRPGCRPRRRGCGSRCGRGTSGRG